MFSSNDDTTVEEDEEDIISFKCSGGEFCRCVVSVDDKKADDSLSDDSGGRRELMSNPKPRVTGIIVPKSAIVIQQHFEN